MRWFAGLAAVNQGSFPVAISHYTQADFFGWLPLTAAYLHANQLQPALLLLQHAIAHTYHAESGKRSEVATHMAAAARQLAQEWAGLILRVISDGSTPGGLPLLLFPTPDEKHLGTSKVLSKGLWAACASNVQLSAAFLLGEHGCYLCCDAARSRGSSRHCLGIQTESAS